MKLVKQIIIFLGTFMLYHIVFSSFFSVDENNVLQAPDWYTYLGLGIAMVVTIASRRKNKSKQTDNKRSNPDSLINYLQRASGDIPLDNTANTSVISVEFKPERPQIFTKQNPELGLMAIDQMEGHDFEHWCADALRKLGYRNVEVTPGSGDQGVDVLAQKDGVKYAIQCKRYNSDLGNKPVQEVHAGKAIYHCHVGVVVTNQHFTTGAKQLAEATGTLLWDREWIRGYLESQYRGVPSYSVPAPSEGLLEDDELFSSAVDAVLETGQASVSMLQRRLCIGYARAARLIDKMEELGFVSQFSDSKPRDILITRQQWQAARKKF